MKKTTRNFDLLDEMKWYSVLLEPLFEHSIKEVVTSLRELGASKVETISPGFVSARATGAMLQRLGSIAHIHLKHEAQLRSSS